MHTVIGLKGSVLSLLLLSFSIHLLPTLPAYAEIQCYECHGTKNPGDFRPLDDVSRNASTGGFRGNHRTHLGPAATAASCDPCHAGPAGTPFGYSSAHSDGKIQVSDNINRSPHLDKGRYSKDLGQATFFNQTTVPQLGSCTNVNCHFESPTPAWGSPPFTAPGDCDKCHSTNPTTGSHPGTGGKHAGYGCNSCHPDHATFSHATSGRVNFEFFPVPGGSYSGNRSTFLPSQLTGKTYGTCSNVFCHSDGTTASTGGAATTTSPVWGSTGSTTCTSCHGYPPRYQMDQPKSNMHFPHARYSCAVCHWTTTTDGVTLTNSGTHGNGAYDVVQGPGFIDSYSGNAVTFQSSPDIGGASCSNISCHFWKPPWANFYWGPRPDFSFDRRTGPGCFEGILIVAPLSGTQPFTYNWDFGDGTTAKTVSAPAPGYCDDGSCTVIRHTFPDSKTYNIRVDARDANRHPGYTIAPFTPQPVNYLPVVNKTVVMNGLTATLSDLSTDPDYNICEHSGPARVVINWGDGSNTDQEFNLTATPSNRQFTHVYPDTPNNYIFRYTIYDNAGGQVSSSVQFAFRTIPVETANLEPLHYRLSANVDPAEWPNAEYKWDFGDGTTGTGRVVDHLFPSIGSYAVKVMINRTDAMDAASGKVTLLVAGPANIPPVAAKEVAVNDMTVTLTDLSYDTDYNSIGHSGPGSINISWSGDNATNAPFDLSAAPSNQIYTRTYSSPGRYCIEHRVTDNSGDTASSAAVGVLLPGSAPLSGTTVGGGVTAADGSPLAGVTVNLKANGTPVGTTTTDSSGSYNFAGLSAGTCYTLEAAQGGTAFFPPSTTGCTHSCADTSRLDFAVASPPENGPAISGRVTDENGTAIRYAGVSLSLRGTGINYVETDISGYYSVQAPSDDCYDVTVYRDGYAFATASRKVCTDNSSVDFTGALKEPPMSVRGTVLDAAGAAVSALITLTGSNGTVIKTYSATSNGAYLATVSPPGCYTATPTKEGWAFTPESRQVCGSSGQTVEGEDFTGQEIIPFIDISGHVTIVSGQTGSTDWLVLKKGNETISTVYTAADGSYRFPRVPAACYTVVAQSGSVITRVYTPASREVCATATDVDFEGRAAPLMNLTGAVTDENNAGLQAVTVKLKSLSGAELMSTATKNADGTYAFYNLAEGCYIVEPQPASLFAPSSLTLCSANTKVNFASRNYLFRIKGNVADVSAGGIDGVTVRVKDAGGNVVGSAVTMNGGNYTLGRVLHGCYTVEPVPAGTEAYFPASLNVCSENLAANFFRMSAPPASEVTATPISTTVVKLLWTDQSSDETGFKIERCTGDPCSDFAQIADRPAGTVLYDDITACQGTTYSYRVKQYRAGSWETVSPAAVATTPAPQSPILTASTQAESRVSLSWSDPNSDESGFSIERCSGDPCDSFSEVATVGPNVTSYNDDGLAPGIYSYRVSALKNAGCPWRTAPSPVATVSTVSPPIADLTHTTAGTTQANLAWRDNTLTATGYTIERCSGANCAFTQIATVERDPFTMLGLNMDEPAWSGLPGEVMDSSGNGNHGAVFNGATTVPEGKKLRAASFDGVDDYVVAPADGRNVYQWSVELWVKPTASPSQKTIFQWSDSADPATASPFLQLLRLDSNTVEWVYPYLNGTYASTTSQSLTVPDNQWTHLVATYDGTNLRFYTNGVLAPFTPNIMVKTYPERKRFAMFGSGKGFYSVTPKYYTGLIDGAAIYSRLLSDADVMARYKAGEDAAICSNTTYQYRVRGVNRGLANSGGGCWTHRVKLNIADFQPEFQTRVVIPYAPEMRGDFGDLRFYDATNGRDLPYWLENKTDGATATFWLRTGKANDIYLYYGNPLAVTSTNGKKVFEAFDDFSATIPANLPFSETKALWAPTLWYYSGWLNISAPSGAAAFNFSTSSNYTWPTTGKMGESLDAGVNTAMDYQVQVKLNSYSVPNLTQAGIGIYSGTSAGGAYTFGRYRNDSTGTNGFRLEDLAGANATNVADITLPAYLAVRKVGAGYSFLLSYDNANWTQVGPTITSMSPQAFTLFVKELTNDISVVAATMDDFYVRKYTANEPQVSLEVVEQLPACQDLAWQNPYSEPLIVTMPPPAAPTGLTATPYDVRIDLAWSDTTSDETGFKIERCQGSGCSNFSQVATVGGSVSTYSDTGLTLGATYRYRVRAYKTAACSWDSDYSSSVTATTSTIPPGNLTAAPANTTQVNLSWTDNASSETGFALERCQGAGCSNFAQIATIAANTTNFQDQQVCTATSYSYRIKSVSGFTNAGGGCWQGRKPLTITNFQPNYQIKFTLDSTGLTARSDFADLRFFDATTGRELPYWIERINSSTSADIWLKTGDNNDISLYYGNPSATSSSNPSLVFETWDDFNASAISGLWSMLSGSGSITQTGTGSLNFSYTGSSSNDWTAAGRMGAALQLKTLPAGDFQAMVKLNSYTTNTLTHAGIAVSGSDTEAYQWGRYRASSTANFSLTKNGGAPVATATPSLPLLLTIRRQGSAYSFFYNTDSKGPYTQVGESYSDIPFNRLVLFGREWGTSNLIFGMDYFLIRKFAAIEPVIDASASPIPISTCSAIPDSGFSNTASVTTPSPAAPTGLAALTASESRINLSWTDNSSDETGFRVERCQGSGCSDFTEIATTAANVKFYSDNGLAAGQSYSYRIRGYKTTSACSWSSDYSATSTAATNLPAIMDLTAVPAGSGKINLAWTDVSGAETGYRIERCSGSGCTDFNPFATVGVNVKTYQDTTATEPSGYTYRVRAVSEGFSGGNGGCWTRRFPFDFWSDGFIPNYQVVVSVPFLSGMKSDFSDIRFYDATAGRELPYWIESKTNGVSARVWFKSGDNRAVFLYYGNPLATSMSSGSGTFEVFEEFDGTTIGPLWTLLPGSGSITQNGLLSFSYTGSQANDWNGSGRQGAALLLNNLPAGDWLAKITVNNTPDVDQTQFGISLYNSDTDAVFWGRYHNGTVNNTSIIKSDGTVINSLAATYLPMTLFIQKLGSTYKFYESPTLYPSRGSVTGSFTGLALFGREWGSNNLNFTLDQFIIRKSSLYDASLYVKSSLNEPAAICADIWSAPYSNEASAAAP